MPGIIEIIINILVFIAVLLIVYVYLLRSRISTWGAADEATQPLIGDDLAEAINATRAITIEAPISQVWKWVIQLGADRAGFFSYHFLERMLGYKMRDAAPTAEFSDMEVGRIIPTSIDESKSIIKYNFPVVAVEPGTAFVLKGWGAFVLREVNPGRTRLIVRTHWREAPHLVGRLMDLFGEAAHYIMERRMLMGLKFQIENGTQVSSIVDILWMLGMVLIGFGIAILIFFTGGVYAFLLSILLGILWLYTLLMFDPLPQYSFGFFFLTIAAMLPVL